MIATGLEACQVESDSEHLDSKSEDMMAEINQALAAFNDANHKFLSAKEVSKEKLKESREKLQAASKEVQESFEQLQDVCEVFLGWCLPSLMRFPQRPGELDEMSVDAVKGELEQVENELEMNLATNRSVIDQYQQRQAQVSVSHYQPFDTPFTVRQIEQLTQELTEEEARAEQIGITIETARVGISFLERLLTSNLTHHTGLMGTCAQGSGFQHRFNVFCSFRSYDRLLGVLDLLC